MRRGQPANIAESFDGLRSDYAAARQSRFTRKRRGLVLSGSGADYHYRSEADYLRVMEYARDMDRNDAIVGRTLDLATLNTIQGGFSVDPTTGNTGLDQELAGLWYDWGNDPDQCDISGEKTFAEMEELVFRQSLSDGDIFTLLLSEEEAVELVEAHRCRTPQKTKKNVVHGILLNERRQRMEYWFTRDEIDPLMPVRLVGETVAYPARDEDGFRQVLHVYHPKRVSQTRGVSALAPIFDLCGMFEDINFAKLVQQQVVSCFAIFRQRELGFGGQSDPAQQGLRETETRADGSVSTIEGVAPGMMVAGQPGEEIRGFSPNVPNAEFFEHVKLILTLIGINLGLPLVMVLLDASETNFSGWRGAVDQSRLGFRRNQRSVAARWQRPIYLWKVRQWAKKYAHIRAALEKDKLDIFSHSWNLPTWPYIEPFKDASTDLLRTRNALISQRRRCHERNLDWDDLSTEIVEDNALAIEKAKERARKLNEDLRDPSERVHWRELLSLPTPDGVQVSLVADSPSSRAGDADGNA